MGARTRTKSVPNHFKFMAPGFMFITPKGQETNIHFIHLRRFYWLALHFYTSSILAKNTFFGTFDPVSLENQCQFSTSVFGFYGKKPIEISYHWTSAKKKSSKMSDSVIFSCGKGSHIEAEVG